MRRAYIPAILIVLAGIGYGVGYLLRAGEQTVDMRPQLGDATDRYLAALLAADAKAAWAETAAAARTRYNVTEAAVAGYVEDAAKELVGPCESIKEEGFILTEKAGKPAAARRRFTIQCADGKQFDVNTEIVAEAEVWRTSFFQYGEKKTEK